MKCAKCATDAPIGELTCVSCGAAVSLLSPGEIAPRLQHTRIIELISNAPPGLLWMAENEENHERVIIAEYEPKRGGKALLQDFNLFYKKLKNLPPGILPSLGVRYTHEERLFLVFDKPAGPSARELIKAGRTVIAGHEMLRRFLILLQQYTEAVSGASHGWIRPETVTVADTTFLLGPPAFSPAASADPRTDFRECALLAAEWAGIPLRAADAEEVQRKQLQSSEDWPLGATIEWILFGKERAPQSVGQIIEFLRESLTSDSEEDRSPALDSLKKLYQRSGSTIIKLKIEQTEEQLSKIANSRQSRPKVKAPPPLVVVPPPVPDQHRRYEPKLESLPPVRLEPQPEPKPPEPIIPPPPLPNVQQPTPPRLPPQKKPAHLRWAIALAAGAIFGAFGIYYYVANAPVREFNDFFDKQMIVNSNGPSAYSVYQKTAREKGPESGAIKSMNEKALPVLKKISQDSFDSWYKESELSKPAEKRAPGELALTTWAEMVQIQEWISNIERTPLSNARLAYSRGMAALNRRAWDEARQHFDEALGSQPNWSLALNGLGKAYFGKRQFDMSEKYYRQASEADPSWYFPHSNLGTLYRDVLKNFDGSEREFRAAIQLDPNRPSFHYNLGLLDYLRGKQYWPSACSELRTALTASSRSLAPAEVNLATLRRDKTCQGQ